MYSFCRLQTKDVDCFGQLMDLFAEVFEEPDIYKDHRPDETYIRQFLANENHFVLVAKNEEEIVGGLVGYILEKFEQNRKEAYVYDLAVSAKHRRKGVASGLFALLEKQAKKAGCYLIYVQAEKVDKDAIKFYKTLNISDSLEAVHFEILV